MENLIEEERLRMEDLKLSFDLIQPHEIGVLPLEMLAHILEFLDFISLCSASRVCQAWNDLCNRDTYWFQCYKSRWQTTDIIELMPHRTWRQRFLQRWKMEKFLEDLFKEQEEQSNTATSSSTNGSSTSTSNAQQILQDFNRIGWRNIFVQLDISSTSDFKLNGQSFSIDNTLKFGEFLKKKAEERLLYGQTSQNGQTNNGQTNNGQTGQTNNGQNNNTGQTVSDQTDVNQLTAFLDGNEEVDSSQNNENQTEEKSPLDSCEIELLLQLAGEEYASILAICQYVTLPVKDVRTHPPPTVVDDTNSDVSATSSSSDDNKQDDTDTDSRNTKKKKIVVPPEVYLRYADIVYSMARLKEMSTESNIVELLEVLFLNASTMYEKAAVPGFFMQENAIRYSGDCLVDFSRKCEGEKSQKLLAEACKKYELSISINPSYFMAHYYYGRALHLLAVAKKGSPDTDDLFHQSINRFMQAKQLRNDDVYVLYEHASTLHDFAQSKVGSEAEELFRAASDKYSEALSISPEDAWILRNWADTLYDHSKLIYTQMLENEDHFSERIPDVETLINEACAKYEKATSLNANYSNAYNSWALALSTCAKVTWDEEKSERLFAQSYEKFEQAILTRSDNSNIEMCNWAMTLVSQAVKRARFLARKDNPHSVNVKAYSPKLSHPGCKLMFKEAMNKLRPMIEKKDTWSYFCLARLYSAKGKEDKCREWLLKCLPDGYLRRATKWQLTYFENVKNTPWFKELLEQSKNPNLK